jgi:hypothetical protein
LIPRSPLEVMPARVAAAVADQRYWFVIGGQAVRCFLPYRPSRDVDFGVLTAKNLRGLVEQLERSGSVNIIEKGKGTVHLSFEGVDVSVFLLPRFKPFTANNTLTLMGLLATKLHAIIDRGTRRDFFDLYVLLQIEGVGLAECFDALRTVYDTEFNQGLVLRALSYFDDAEEEAALPGEGRDDWDQVKAFFSKAVGALIVPPIKPLAIQGRCVDVRVATPRGRGTRRKQRK